MSHKMPANEATPPGPDAIQRTSRTAARRDTRCQYRKLLSIPASLLFLAVPPTAHGQGDPAHGETLYVTTYKCVSCHGNPPPRNISSGATAAGIVDAIGAVSLMTTRFSTTLAENPADLADIAAYIASVLSPPTTPDLNQHGLTGSWYEAASSGQGVEIEVYPNSMSGTGSTFLSWFTYDTAAGGADHQRWYTAQGSVVTGQPNASLTIYQNTGGNFNAPPVTMAQSVGTATLSFSSCMEGKLAYTFTDGTGRMGNIPLTRLLQNVTCSTTTPYATNPDFALSGNWFDSATAGQGITVEVNPVNSYLFMAWYAYAPMGAAAGASGQRWYTAQAPFTAGLRSIPVTIYETTGGIFDTPTPASQQTVAVGTGTLAFQSCTAATFSYHFTGGSSSGLSGTITLSRVGPTPPGCTS
jgi:hypothetical protein